MLWAGEPVEIKLWQPPLHHSFPSLIFQNKVPVSGEIIAESPILKVVVAVKSHYPAKSTDCPVTLFYPEGEGKKKAVFKTLAEVKPSSSTISIDVTLGNAKIVNKIFPLPTTYTNAQYQDNFGEIVTGKPHKDAVRSLTFTRDSRYLVSAADDGNIHIMVPQTLQIIKTIPAHKRYVRKVIVTPDGNYIVSCSDDRTIKVWDFASGKLIHTFTGSEAPIYAMAISQDGRYVASGDIRVRLWDLQERKAAGMCELIFNQINALVFTPDGRFVISGDEGKFIYIWDMSDQSKKYKRIEAHMTSVMALAMHPTMEFLYSGDKDEAIKWWKVLLNPKDSCWDGDDDLLWEMRLVLIKNRHRDPANLTLKYITKYFAHYPIIHRYPVYNLTKKPADMETDDNEWKKKTSNYAKFDLGGAIMALELNGSGEFLCVVTSEGEMRIIEMYTAVERCCFTIGHPLQCGAFSYDGSLSAAGDLYGNIWVYGIK
jgi:WD40 repeat protein